MFELGVLKIDQNWQICREPNELRIKIVKPTLKSQDIFKQFPKVFDGVGLPQECRVLLTATTKEMVKPRLKQRIFEPAPDGESITWCTPLLIHPK